MKRNVIGTLLIGLAAVGMLTIAKAQEDTTNVAATETIDFDSLLEKEDTSAAQGEVSENEVSEAEATEITAPQSDAASQIVAAPQSDTETQPDTESDTTSASSEAAASEEAGINIDTTKLGILGADNYTLEELKAIDDTVLVENDNASDTTSDECEKENEYADLAIANVTNYVNIRSNPDTESEIVGKIYNGAVAQILSVAGDNDDWFQVVSGNVEGYIKAEYFIYGDAAADVIDNYVTRYAVVKADRLNVRQDPDKESQRIGYIDSGEKVKLLENQGEWLKVAYTSEKIGYVASEYVDITEEFVYAKTIAEEEAEIAETKVLEERETVSEETASEDVTITVTPPSTNYSSNSELRSSIVNYSMQFLGNKYVHGGQTLEGGTDCSGFTSLIYKEYGYSLSRTPDGQLSGAGRSISYSEAQPGDIICYGSGSKCTHVALYIGNGQIIHSANSRKGVVIYNADYDTIIGVKNIID